MGNTTRDCVTNLLFFANLFAFGCLRRYVIGENKPSETPFKFIYYTGKTLQNTYSGAFVYARTPELPDDIMTSVYNIARDAGMDPDKVRSSHA